MSAVIGMYGGREDNRVNAISLRENSVV